MNTQPEAPESVKYHGGYDPSDPPQGEHYCSECCRWDDECECGDERQADYNRSQFGQPR